MGSSTRNKYPRGNKILQQKISEGRISSNGNGIGNILNDLFFPSKGVSKPRKILQEKIYSNDFKSSIQKIGRLAKSIKTGDFGSIGFGGSISSYSRGEIAEVFCEYLGIENDEILKTSFKESISDSDIVNNGLDALKVATNYVKNIISNIFKQYTFEDSLDNLPSMTEESYEKEIETFSNDNILPIIDVELEKLNFDDDEEFGFKAIETSLNNIMLKLKSVGD